MTRVQPAVLAASLSVLSLVVVLVVVTAVAPDGMAPIAAAVGLGAVVVGLIGGLPVLVPVGVLALVLAHTAAVVGGSDLVHPSSAVVVPAAWVGFEVAMRSFELRPDTRPDRAAALDHLLRVGVIAAGSAAVVLVIVGVVGAVPEGGLAFRLVAVVCAVVLAILAAVLSVSRDPSRS